MRIFWRKPFSLCCFLFICGALTAHFSPVLFGKFSLFFFVSLSLAFCIGAIIKKNRRFFVFFVLPIIFAFLGSLYFTIYSAKLEKNIAKYKFEDKSVAIEATVLSRAFASNYNSIYDVRVHRIGEENVNFKMRYEADYFLDLLAGDRFCANVNITSFESGGSFDEKQYFNSKGVYFRANEIGNSCEFIRIDRSAEVFFLELNEKLCNIFSKHLDEKSAGLIKAVFLGNRSDLSDTAKRDFLRTGAYHILALSGMHLVILTAMLDILLRSFRIGKSRRYIIMTAVILFYVALTGFGLSVVRSAIMLLSTYLSYFLRLKKDSLTSLMFAASAIISFSPSSISDIGFWMSVLATFGIIIVLPLQKFIIFKLRKKLIGSIGKTLKTIMSALIISLAAIIMTLPFSCFGFGAVSLIGPLSTLILSPFVSAVLYLAPFVLIFSSWPVFGDALVFFTDLFAKISLFLADALSTPRGIYLSLEYDFVPYMIIPLYIVLAIFLIIHIKHKMIIPVLLVVWLCAFSVMEHFAVNSPTYRFEYMREDKNEYICISSSGKNTLVDISDGSSGDLYEASKRATLLGYREIETVLLTHIHKRHINSLCKIASETMVRNVILPKPIKESEHSIYESIKYEMELLGVNVSEYSNGEKIGLLNGFEVSAKRIYKSRSTHPAIFIEFSGNLDAVYIGSSYLEYDDEMINGDKVFIGSHGPKCKNEFIIYPKNGAFVSIATKELTELLKISGKGDFKIINSVESVIFCGENK